MKNLFRTLTLAAFTATIGLSAHAQGEARDHFSKGSVYQISMIQTEANSQDKYLMQLKRMYIPMMQAAKEAGMILSYKILTGGSSNASDYDVLLMIEYRNMAAFDDTPETDAKWKAVRDKVLAAVGGEATREDIQQVYTKIRTTLGQKVMRERVLK